MKHVSKSKLRDWSEKWLGMVRPETAKAAIEEKEVLVREWQRRHDEMACGRISVTLAGDRGEI